MENKVKVSYLVLSLFISLFSQYFFEKIQAMGGVRKERVEALNGFEFLQRLYMPI